MLRKPRLAPEREPARVRCEITDAALEEELVSADPAQDDASPCARSDLGDASRHRGERVARRISSVSRVVVLGSRSGLEDLIRQAKTRADRSDEDALVCLGKVRRHEMNGRRSLACIGDARD